MKRDNFKRYTSQKNYFIKSDEIKVIVFSLLVVLLSGIDNRFKQETPYLIIII